MSLILIFILLFFALYLLVVRPIYLSPLSSIPNAHFLSPITSIWIQWKRISGYELTTVNEAFRSKGPVVRLGPNDLAVNKMDGGVKVVYGGGFEKTDWYSLWRNYEQVSSVQPNIVSGIDVSRSPNIFSSLDKKEHTSRRRRIANLYTKTSIQSSPHIMRIIEVLIYQRLLPQFAQSAVERNPIEVLDLNMAYGLDFVSAFIFGLPRGTNFIQDVMSRNHWLARYLRSHPNQYMFWLLEVPNLRKWLANLGIYVTPKWIWEARGELDEWALGLINRTEVDIADADAKWTRDGDHPVVYNQLKRAMNEEQEMQGMNQHLEIASECLDHLVATRDVFGIAYTFVIYELSRHPEAQRDLRKELLSFRKPLRFPSPRGDLTLPTPKELESLPLLNAMIKESLRLRGTLPAPAPRITPHDKKTTIGQYENIPGGVRISSFAWCLHRNEDIFPSAEEWRPERWLGDKANRMEQERWFWAFGSGSRMCLGDHLSMEMIRYAVAAIYTNFATTIIDSEGFNYHEKWVTGKPGDRLVLMFETIGATDEN